MAFDPVPYIVAGGAVHSAEVMRTLAYAALGGKEGIVEAIDLKVEQLASPGGGVRITPGAAGIINRYPDQVNQAYVGRNGVHTPVTIAPTSGSPRNDMIIVRIDDPQYGGTTPTDPADGPYIYPEVIPNVGSANSIYDLGLSYPAIALARVDIPPSTSVITNAMIRDLRNVIAPRSQRELFTLQPAGDYYNFRHASNTQMWPNVPTAWPLLRIPRWATRAILSATIGGVRFEASGGVGSNVVKIGEAAQLSTQATTYSGEGSAPIRATLLAAGTIDIPESIRGTDQRFYVSSRSNAGLADGQRAKLDSGSSIVLDIQFDERPA